MRIQVVATVTAVTALTFFLMGNVIYAGGGKRKKQNDDQSIFKFNDDLSDAEDEAAEEKKPILMVVCATYSGDDYKPVEKMCTWPYAIVGSHRDYVATRESLKNKPELKTLCEKMHVKTLPALIWMDAYGNPVSIQSFPESATQIQAVAQSWPQLSAKVDKFFKDHIDHGDRFVKYNRFKEGYNEYAFAAAFKGPLPDRAREAQKKIKEQWNKLLEIAKTSPAKERGLILQGIQRETSGTELEHQMLTAVTDAMSASTDKPAAAPEKTATTPAATSVPGPNEAAKMDASKAAQETKVADANPPKEEPKAVAPAAPAAPAAPTPEKILENKTLGDLANSSTSSLAAAEPDDSQVGSVLLTKADPKLKEAHTLIQTAAASYRKAIADATERGPARNEMLRTAYQNLSKAADILDAANAAKPDAQIDKVSQDISMMMYGCLKYQSL